MNILVAEPIAPAALDLLRGEPGWNVIVSNPRTDAATRYYVQRQLLEFRLAGVDKDDATREKINKLQDKLTEDQSMFDRNISDDVRTVEVDDASELDGLPQDYIDHHKPGADGKIHITTAYPDLFPPMNFAKSDALRRRLWEAYDSRAYPKNRDRSEEHTSELQSLR